MRSTTNRIGKRLAGSGFLAVLCLVLSSCSGSSGGSSGSDDGDGGRPEITITISSESLATQLTRLAESQGFFEDAGVDVTLLNSNGGAQAVTAMLAGDAQFAQAGAPEIITTNAEGQEILAVGNMYTGLSGSVVLSAEAAAAAGVEGDLSREERLASPDISIEDRLAALDGLNISFASATSSLLQPVVASAEEEGATVNPVYIQQSSSPAALSSGAVDAVMASPPVSELAVVEADGVMWISGPEGEFPEELTPTSSSTLMTTRDFLDENPDAVRMLAEALTMAAQFIADSPAEAEADVQSRFADVDQDVFDAVWAANYLAFTTPEVTADDFAHDIAILPEASRTDEVEALNPEDLVVPSEFVPQDAST